MSMQVRFFVTALFVAFISLACGAEAAIGKEDDSTTPASCAFIHGNGKGGNRGKLTRILLPAQTNKDTDTDEVVEYFPCNSRNFIINDGTIYNANGEKVGDRFTLIMAHTKSGVPITIAAHAEWTLNQNDKAMRLFFKVCLKYRCAASKDEAGKANYSTPGWNGMLGETMGLTMDLIGQKAAFGFDDDLWLSQDPTLREQLADGMSKLFASTMRARFGYSEDLFCGSGNSRWPDEENPGKGEFNCTPVRIVVDDVQLGVIGPNDLGSGVAAVNRLRLANATALYGPNAGAYLAQLDTIEACNKKATACVFNTGGTQTQATVAVTPPPTPTPAGR